MFYYSGDDPFLFNIKEKLKNYSSKFSFQDSGIYDIEILA